MRTDGSGSHTGAFDWFAGDTEKADLLREKEEKIKMVKTVLKIDGMMCSMCESHVNDCIRAAFNVKKVSSSHSKGETVIISDTPLDEDALKEKIAATGYELLGVSTEPYEKKSGLFGLFGKKN